MFLLLHAPFCAALTFKPNPICGVIVAEDGATGQGASSLPLSSAVSSDLQPFNVTPTPVATRSVISIDLSGTYWLTFISFLWKVLLMLTVYWTAKMECLCHPLVGETGVWLYLSFKDAHSRYDKESQKWAERVEITHWVNAHETAAGENTITSVVSDICLLWSWLQTACLIYIFFFFFETRHPY